MCEEVPPSTPNEKYDQSIMKKITKNDICSNIVVDGQIFRVHEACVFVRSRGHTVRPLTERI